MIIGKSTNSASAIHSFLAAPLTPGKPTSCAENAQLSLNAVLIKPGERILCAVANAKVITQIAANLTLGKLTSFASAILKNPAAQATLGKQTLIATAIVLLTAAQEILGAPITIVFLNKVTRSAAQAKFSPPTSTANASVTFNAAHTSVTPI